MTAIRFSKSATVSALLARAEALEVMWRFDPNNGTAQLAMTASSPGDRDHNKRRAVAYGEYNFCVNLAKWIEEGQFPSDDFKGQGITGTL